MSGPVWRRIEGEKVICDLCLIEIDTTMVEGKIEDAEFKAWRRLCEDCYTNSISLIG